MKIAQSQDDMPEDIPFDTNSIYFVSEDFGYFYFFEGSYYVPEGNIEHERPTFQEARQCLIDVNSRLDPRVNKLYTMKFITSNGDSTLDDDFCYTIDEAKARELFAEVVTDNGGEAPGPNQYYAALPNGDHVSLLENIPLNDDQLREYALWRYLGMGDNFEEIRNTHYGNGDFAGYEVIPEKDLESHGGRLLLSIHGLCVMERSDDPGTCMVCMTNDWETSVEVTVKDGERIEYWGGHVSFVCKNCGNIHDNLHSSVRDSLILKATS